MKKLAILAIVGIVLVSGCVQTLTPYQRNFAGVTLNFRANLDEASKVGVYPNSTSLIESLLNNKVQQITVAYIPNSTENGFYAADSFELAYKLTVINKYYFNKTKTINSIAVNSTNEAFQLSSDQMPVIMLLGPSQTNLTGVFVQRNYITVEGASLNETNRTYTDLDLATDKLLLVLMGE